MRRHGFAAAIALVVAFVAGQTFAATMNFWLSVEGLGELTGGPSVPNLTIDLGEEVTLTIWVQTQGAHLIGGTFSVAKTNADVVNTVDGSILAYDPVTFGQPRWNAGFFPGTSTAANVYHEPIFVAVGGPNGVGTQITEFADTTYAAAFGAYPLASFTIRGDQIGTTDLFFEVAGGGMAYSNTDPEDTLAVFGAGNDAINAHGNINLGGRSALADATITVVPEPASLGLLALGALALVRRRR
jgi:hypothetical protein